MARIISASAVLALFAATSAAGDGAVDVREDFDAATLPAAWRVTGAWTPAESALRGKGGGRLDLAQPIGGDYDLTFDGSVSEKANVEVHLVDPTSGQVRFAFAFLGRFHSVLKGVKACLLADDRFVSVTPEMWIWPGRRFAFHVRRTGNDLAMFLDGVAGPAWTDPRPAAATLVRIVVAPETENAEVVLDSIRLHAARPTADATAAPPAPPPAPKDPAAAPIVDTAKTKNVSVVTHSDPSLVAETIAGQLQQQYDWLREWVGAAPEQVVVHVSADYSIGFARPTSGAPEMFLQAGPIYDSSANYAHEMCHCFLFRYGRIPHWFNESMSDMAYADSEIGLWKRRKEAALLQRFDRVEERSYELAKLRMKYGKDYFPKVCRLLEKNADKCRATFRDDVALEARNELLLSILSEAAGEDLRPRFRDEFGFDAKTRERQRGY